VVVAAVISFLIFRGMNKQVQPKSTETAEKVVSQVSETAAPAGTPVASSAAKDEDESCIYVVQPKDSLISIAENKLGDFNRWQEIYKANSDQIKDPDVIYAGQRFKVCKK